MFLWCCSTPFVAVFVNNLLPDIIAISLWWIFDIKNSFTSKRTISAGTSAVVPTSLGAWCLLLIRRIIAIAFSLGYFWGCRKGLGCSDLLPRVLPFHPRRIFRCRKSIGINGSNLWVEWREQRWITAWNNWHWSRVILSSHTSEE